MRLIPRNSLLRWSLGIGLAILLFFGTFGGLRWKAYRESAEALRAIEAKLDAEDPGWRFEEMQAGKQPLPDERNSYPFIAKAIAAIDAKRSKVPGEQDSPPTMAEHRVLPEILEGEAADWFGQYLADRQEALKAARAVRNFPEGRHPIAWKPDFISTILHSVQECRQVCFLLTVDSAVQAQFGDFNAAFDDLHAMRNVARSLGKEDGTLIVMLVRIALNAILADAVKGVLATGEADPKRLAELQAMIEEDMQVNILRDALRVERGGAKAVYNAYMKNPDDLSIKETKQFLARFRYEPYKLADLATYLELMTDALASCEGEPDQIAVRLAGVDRRLPKEKEEGMKRVFTRLLIPSITRMGETYCRWHAQLRTLAVALAVERFRMAEKRWPANLNELVPKYIAKLPVDPFNGTPLGYAKKDDGVVVYSVGKDGQDNGGDVMANRRIRQQVFDDAAGGPPGAAQPAPEPGAKPKDPEWEVVVEPLQPTDVGIKLWNPESRRKRAPTIEVKDGDLPPGGVK